MQRVVYTDSNGNEQVIAVQGFAPDNIPNSGDAETSIDHSVEIYQNNKFNKFKVWTNSALYDTIPLGASNFQSSEPEIFVQEYDGSSWVNQFRGFLNSKGAVKSDGSYEFTLYDHSKWVGESQVSIGPVTDTIPNVLQTILPSGYTVEHPTDVTIPQVQDYRLNDQRQVGFRDVTEKFNWVLRFTARTDGSGNWVVRHEPEGYGGTVDTLTGQSSGGLTKFKDWEKGKTDSIINKVTVVGNDTNGNKVTGTVSDSTSISEYGEHFKRVPVDFNIPDTSTAETIAQSYIVTDPTEGGRVKLRNGYDDPVVNDSFELVDDNRNLSNDVFTAVKQKNYYPEGSTELDFTFEKESERQARESDNLRAERNEIKDTGNTEAGQQNFTGDTGSAPSDTGTVGGVTDNESDTGTVGGVTDNQSDTAVTGGIQAESLTFEDYFSESRTNVSIGSGYTPVSTANAVDVNTDVLYHRVFIRIQESGTVPNTLYVQLTDDDGAKVFLQTSVQPRPDDTGYIYVNEMTIPANAYSGGYQLRLGASSSIDVGLIFDVDGLTHSHPDDFDTDDNLHPHGDDIDTTDNLHPHGDDIDTSDNQHGGTGDPTGQHGASGETDSKQIEVIDITKEDR